MTRYQIAAFKLREAPIAQLDRASDYGSKNAPFAIFINGYQSTASFSPLSTCDAIALAMVFSDLL
jgi:hypothetical protein